MKRRLAKRGVLVSSRADVTIMTEMSGDAAAPGVLA